MARLLASGVAAAALLAVMTPAHAIGVTYDKLAYLTFSAPVQIPGATLGAGTYRFHLTNPETSRNVLQVLSHDGSIVYAMFHTIPDVRTALSEDPEVTFRETRAGVPPAVRSLFYGGEYKGYEFVYPAGGPIAVAEVVPQPAVTYAPIPPAVPEPAAERAPAFAPEPVAAAPVAAESARQAEPVELPRTATPVPLLAFAGGTSVLVGLGIGLIRRRIG